MNIISRFIDICQIRLDFVEVKLQQPASTTGATTTGDCVDTILAITPGTSSSSIYNKPPDLCGTLTGQHGKLNFYVTQWFFLKRKFFQ